MEQILNECTALFAETPEYSTLINYRMRETRLTMDDKLRVAKTIEHAYAPLLDHLKADVPSLSDSDLLFCIMSILHIESIAIAEMLAISMDTVRVRKYRLRDKLPQRWFDLFFTDAQVIKDQNHETPVDKQTSNNITNMNQKATMMRAVGNCFRNYLNPSGRSSRIEYWYLLLFAAIVYFVVNSAMTYILFHATNNILEPKEHEALRYIFYAIHFTIVLVLTPPLYTTTVRRLHDLNLKGWLAVILCARPVAVILTIKIANLVSTEWVILHTQLTETSFGHFVILHMTCKTVLVMFLIIIILIFTRSGTVGPNDFGPDPLRFISHQNEAQNKEQCSPQYQ